MDEMNIKNRNRIGRSIYETRCIGSRYDPEIRKVVEFDEVIRGNIRTITRASNILKKKLNSPQLIVEEMHHIKAYVSAPIEKFLEIVDERTEREID